MAQFCLENYPNGSGITRSPGLVDLDHMNLSFEIFFIQSCLMQSLLPQLSGSTFILSKINTKSRKLGIVPNFNCGNGSLVVPKSAIQVLLTNYKTFLITYDYRHLNNYTTLLMTYNQFLHTITKYNTLLITYDQLLHTNHQTVLMTLTSYY